MSRGACRVPAAWHLVILWLLTATVGGQAQDSIPRPPGLIPAGSAGFRLYVEEDFLYDRRNMDRNYTGGLGIGIGGRDEAVGAYRTVALFDRWLRMAARHAANNEQLYSGLLFLTAFTPDSLKDDQPIYDDRPYASLEGWTARHLSIGEKRASVWRTEATIGVLGLNLARNAQRYIHKRSRAGSGKDTPYDPKGWQYQISAGGEPTFMYAVAYEAQMQGLLRPREWNRYKKAFEATWGWQGSVGYYTELDGALTARLGMFGTSFWEFRSNPMSGANKAPGEFPLDLFAFGALRPRAMLYNALLQGQVRHSEVRFSFSEVEHFGVEFDAGAEIGWRFGAHRLSATAVWPAGRSNEYRGPNARTHTWGSLFIGWQ